MTRRTVPFMVLLLVLLAAWYCQREIERVTKERANCTGIAPVCNSPCNLRPSFAKRLRQQQERVAAGDKGTPLAAALKECGL